MHEEERSHCLVSSKCMRTRPYEPCCLCRQAQRYREALLRPNLNDQLVTLCHTWASWETGARQLELCWTCSCLLSLRLTTRLPWPLHKANTEDIIKNKPAWQTFWTTPPLHRQAQHTLTYCEHALVLRWQVCQQEHSPLRHGFSASLYFKEGLNKEGRGPPASPTPRVDRGQQHSFYRQSSHPNARIIQNNQE